VAETRSFFFGWILVSLFWSFSPPTKLFEKRGEKFSLFAKNNTNNEEEEEERAKTTKRRRFCCAV
jgi:hypothetical protein